MKIWLLVIAGLLLSIAAEGGDSTCHVTTTNIDGGGSGRPALSPAHFDWFDYAP